MVNAADNGGGSHEATAVEPWERAVRQVILQSHPDALDDMSATWHTFTAGLKTYHDRFAKIWDTYLDESWRGEAAVACRLRWEHVATQMSHLIDNYDVNVSLVKDSATTLRHAIGKIPIPIYPGTGAPVLPGGKAESPHSDGLHSDYQQTSDAYQDFAFLNKALELDIGSGPLAMGTRSTTGHGSAQNFVSSQQHNLMADRDRAIHRDAVKSWYSDNQFTAGGVHDELRSSYAEAQHNVPGPTPAAWSADPTSRRAPADPGHHGAPAAPAGGSDNAPPSVGALPTPVGGAVTSASNLPHSLPPHGVLGPPTYLSADPLSDGAADPVHGTSLASDGATMGGSPGAGSAGIAGGGLGGVGTTPTGTTGDWWRTPSTGNPLGPRVPLPGLTGASGVNRATQPTAPVGGMMPHAGAAQGKQDDRTTWLTEDDDQMWGPRWDEMFDGYVE